jgi:hypothetical protein
VEQAPGWLSYASPAIALLSLAVATATFRRQSVRLRCSAKALWDFKVNLSEENHGHWRAAIIVHFHSKTVLSVGVESFVIYQPRIVRDALRYIVQPSDVIGGPRLPHPLPGLESQRWDIVVETIEFNGEELVDPQRILAILGTSSLIVKLGNGRSLTRRISLDQTPATRLD